MRLLTDEEMEKILGIDFTTAYSGHIAEYKAIRNAQADLTRKEMETRIEKCELTDEEIARALEGITMFKKFDLSDAITPADRVVAQAMKEKILEALKQLGSKGE